MTPTPVRDRRGLARNPAQDVIPGYLRSGTQLSKENDSKETTVKTQKQITDLEAKTDFAAINGALLERLRRGEFGQRKTIHSLLDRIGDTLLELRRHRVPLRAIVVELKTHGLPVSESRLRAYFRKGGILPGKQASHRKKIKSPPKSSATTRSATGSQGAARNAPTLPMNL
jgi:hypothetical protein